MENRLKQLEDKMAAVVKSIKGLKMTSVLYVPVIFFFILWAVFLFSGSFKRSYDAGPTVHYNGLTTIIGRPVKALHISFTASTGNGGSYDISAAGLTTVLNVQATAMRNTSNAGDVPNIAIKSISTTAIGYNIVQANPATVAILGINVLSGSPQAFPASPGDITIKMIVYGY